MVEISNKNNNKVVRVSVGGSTGNNPTIKPNGDYSSYYSELSKAWAIKMNGMVSKEDYSSKYYATQAKANAETTENNLNSVISEHEQITNEITEARENISGDLTGALTDIVNARDNGVAKVTETKINSLSEIESAKSEAEQTITTGLNNFNTNAQAKSDSLQTQFDTSISDIKKQETTSINAVKKTGFYMQDDKLYYINADGETKEFISGGGRELLEIYIDPFCDESENKGRIANGQIIVQNQFPEATKKLKKRVGWDSENKKATLNTSLVCTEEEWQFIQANSKLGQCGKFVIDDEAGTIRLPAIVNINGLTDLSKAGLIKDESLPAHKHTRGTMEISGGLGTVHQFNYYEEGAFYRSWTGTMSGSGGGKGDWSNWEFRASRNWTGSTSVPDNAIYQDNAPVQQEAVQYPYVICVNTGVEEAERPINNYQVNNPNSLLEGKYTDHILNNLSWLRSQGQYNSGTIYNKAYELILKIYNGTETIEGISVKAKGDSSITDYDFVIDTTNTKFRLPIKSRLASDDTGIYLYYYIGDTLQNADLINIARMQEQITDINTQSRGYLVESFTDGTSGYRLYSDGFCEQRGYSNMGGNTLRTITFLKPYKDTNYVVTLGDSNIGMPNTNSRKVKIVSITTKNMVVTGVFDNGLGIDINFYWRTCGYVK